MRAALTFALLAALAPDAAAATRVNPVTSVTQEQDQWCWAGTTRSALLYFGVDRRQCELADWTRQNNTAPDLNFGAASCCTSPSGACNSWNYFWDSGGSIEELLAHFAGATAVRHDLPGGSLTLAQVVAASDAGRLFFIRWERSNGAGHFLVGHGYDGSLVHYMDPWPGEGLKIAEHAWVASSDTHRWTSTLVVTGQPAPPGCDGKPDGTTCDDGNACTTGDRCVSGACQGAPKTCPAADACHLAGRCDPTTGQCTTGAAADDGTRCDDLDACTTGDQCVSGTCQGTPKTCPAADACHEAGACVAASGRCTTPAVVDGIACSGGTCAAGVCRPSSSLDPSPAPEPQTAAEPAALPRKVVISGCSSSGAAGLAWPLVVVGLLAGGARRRLVRGPRP